jgi:ankyrin repeat protein
VISVLVNAGADVNARTYLKETPLHRAAEINTNPEVISVLLKLGAKPNAKRALGKTPWDLIQKNEALKNTKAYRLLQDARF